MEECHRNDSFLNKGMKTIGSIRWKLNMKCEIIPILEIGLEDLLLAFAVRG